MMKQDNRYFRPGGQHEDASCCSVRRAVRESVPGGSEKRDRLGMRQRTRVTVSSEPARSCHILGMMSAHGSLPHT